ncbi:hypothetical protein [Streptomyces mirabilis]
MRRIGGLSAHPLGIRHVRPTLHQLTIRLLSEPYVVWYWAEMLLPHKTWEAEESSDRRDQVGGVCGLRFRSGSGASTSTGRDTPPKWC